MINNSAVFNVWGKGGGQNCQLQEALISGVCVYRNNQYRKI